MGQRTLVPDADEVTLEVLAAEEPRRLIMRLRPARKQCRCPVCGRSSGRIHSWYRRRLSDLPWEGIPVRIDLRVRKFFCDNNDCKQRIFTERLTETAPWYARRTRRQGKALEQIAWSLGGSAGSRLAELLGILASDSTLLRQLRRRTVSPPATAPRVLGIDDWAWRKGQRYGTILCDLERGKVVDLLAERSAASTEQWLRTHPGAEIISRDRASLYAEAATHAAPQAVQIADRWHLLHNLSDSLIDALRPHHRLLGEVAQAVAKDAAAQNATAKATEGKPASEVATETRPPPVTVQEPTRAQRKQQQNREHRLTRYEAVMELIRQGLSQREVGRQCGISRKTVRRWVRSQSFPERKQSERSSSLDPFRQYLETRWQQGCHNSAQLWRELDAQGFPGRPGAAKAWIRKHFGPRRCRNQQQPPPAAVSPRRTSPRQTAWLLLKQPEDARPYLEELCRRSPQITACATLAREFFRIVRERDASAWPAWRDSATTTDFANFTKNLCRDEAAFLAALQYPWSNGPVEGQVHRLKLIKRSMYGRAMFDLLRIRVLKAA